MLNVNVFVVKLFHAVFVNCENSSAIEVGVPVAAFTDLCAVCETDALVKNTEVIYMFVTCNNVFCVIQSLKHGENTVVIV